MSDETWGLTGGDERLAFLRGLGFDDVEHDSHVPFISHLVGVARVLKGWGARPALCDAGLFHSVYGTEYFPLDSAAQRDDVVAVIGPEAERVAWLWCTIRRDTLDAETRTVDVRDGETLTLSEQELADVAELWAADTVEQIARLTPEEQVFAASLPRALGAATPAAQASVAQMREVLAAGASTPTSSPA